MSGISIQERSSSSSKQDLSALSLQFLFSHLLWNVFRSTGHEHVNQWLFVLGWASSLQRNGVENRT